MSWFFLTDCINSDGDSINEMKRGAKEIKYEAMRRAVGDAFVDKQFLLGYDVGQKGVPKRGSLRMSKDWAVSYWKGKYQGEPCYFFIWSHIEYIFVKQHPKQTRTGEG